MCRSFQRIDHQLGSCQPASVAVRPDEPQVGTGIDSVARVQLVAAGISPSLHGLRADPMEGLGHIPQVLPPGSQKSPIMRKSCLVHSQSSLHSTCRRWSKPLIL